MVENILKKSLEIMDKENMPPGKIKTLEAAVVLFSKQGYNGTSTLEIAKTAGVSQATVFKYFETKEELLSSVISPIIPKLFSSFLGEVESIDTPQGIVLFIVRNRFEFMRENKDIIKIIFSEVLTNEQLKNELILSIGVVFRERKVAEFFEKIKEISPEINQNLTLPEIIRSIAAPLMLYFIQRFVLFDNEESETEEQDLELIERQIYNNLTI